MTRQPLLLADPRPLVTRLGPDFFRQAPQAPGVYLMRDAAGAVIYVGKAKNLRNRLRCYRVANPDRLARRHLRLLNKVAQIELKECSDEATALRVESELLLQLRPRFNRAGTVRPRPRFFLWHTDGATLEIQVEPQPRRHWHHAGPFGAEIHFACDALARLLWYAIHPRSTWAEIPHRWFQTGRGGVRRLEVGEAQDQVQSVLSSILNGDDAPLVSWMSACRNQPIHRFDAMLVENDLETVAQFAATRKRANRLFAEPTTVHEHGQPAGLATPNLFSLSDQCAGL